MGKCKRINQCPFFKDQMAHKPTVAEFYKRKYCTGGEFNACARYIVLMQLGGEYVPADLYPNQTDRLEDILKKS